MKGIALVTGVNCTGKGVVVHTLKGLWEQRFITPLVQINLSQRMREVAGISTHQELEELDDDMRSEIRADVFREVAFAAVTAPYIIDTHCCFEDGEVTDLIPLGKTLCQIVCVEAAPETIMRRLQADSSDHPGRNRMRKEGVAFIRQYMERDKAQARYIIREIEQREGRRIPLRVVSNNFGTQVELRNYLDCWFADFAAGFEAFAQWSKEGYVSPPAMRR